MPYKMKSLFAAAALIVSVLLSSQSVTAATGSDTQSGKLGYIDKTGKTVIASKFNEVNEFSEGLAAVKIVISAKFVDADEFSDGLAKVMPAGSAKYRYIDHTVKLVIKPLATECNKFSRGLALIHQGSKWIYIDKTGKQAIKQGFTDAG